MKKIVLLLILSIFGKVYSQNTISKNEVKKIDGIEVSHKWKHSKCFNKKSPMQLNVQLKNTNDYPAKVAVVVSYYVSGLLKEQSDTVYNCILPKKTAKGSKKKLNFSLGSFSNSDLNKPEFSYEIKLVEVIKMRSCTKEP